MNFVNFVNFGNFSCLYDYRVILYNRKTQYYMPHSPVRLVHRHVVAAELLLVPELELAIRCTCVLVCALPQGVAKLAGPLKIYNCQLQQLLDD